MSVLDSMKDEEVVDKGSTTQRSETGTPSAAKKTPTQVLYTCISLTHI